MLDKYPDVLTIDDVAHVLRISRRSVMRLIADGTISYRKIGLPVKGNKRKAENLVNEFINQYSYLEQLSVIQDNIDPDIELCAFLDLWIEEKSCDICGNTCDTYKSRIVTIKRYFAPRHIRLKDITPKILTDFYHYSLKYGKISQKDQACIPCRYAQSEAVRVSFSQLLMTPSSRGSSLRIRYVILKLRTRKTGIFRKKCCF